LIPLSPRPVGLERPEEERVAAQERAAPRLAVAAPQLLAAADPAQRSGRKPPEDRPQRRVEPDDELCAFEDQVSELPVVAAVCDPAVHGQRLLDTRAEGLSGRLAPAGAPVQRVELDVRNA